MIDQSEQDFREVEHARELPPDELYFAGDSDCLDELHDFGDEDNPVTFAEKTKMPSRYVTSTADTSPESARSDAEPHSIAPGAIWPGSEPRYRLMRLCKCSVCEGTGRALVMPVSAPTGRCPKCRGEGKTLDEIARCDTPADVGVALVTLALEGGFDGCPFGLIDDQGEPGLKWLVRPWVASPRNVSDAARTLAKSKGDT